MWGVRHTTLQQMLGLAGVAASQTGRATTVQKVGVDDARYAGR